MAYIDDDGNYVSDEEQARRQAQARSGGGANWPGGGGSAPPAAPSGGGGGGGPSVGQMTNELIAAGYNGPMDEASIVAAYNRTVNGGNGAGGSAAGGGGGETGLIAGYDYTSFIGQQAMAQANYKLGEARQKYDYWRTQALEIPSMEHKMRMDEAAQKLAEVQQEWLKTRFYIEQAWEEKKYGRSQDFTEKQWAEQYGLDKEKFGWDKEKFGLEQGEEALQDAVQTSMDIWQQKNELADTVGNASFRLQEYTDNPTLPYRYLAREMGADVKARYGREATPDEIWENIMWKYTHPGEERPEHPWGQYGDYSGVSQPQTGGSLNTVGKATPYPNPGGNYSGGLPGENGGNQPPGGVQEPTPPDRMPIGGGTAPRTRKVKKYLPVPPYEVWVDEPETGAGVPGLGDEPYRPMPHEQGIPTNQPFELGSAADQANRRGRPWREPPGTPAWGGGAGVFDEVTKRLIPRPGSGVQEATPPERTPIGGGTPPRPGMVKKSIPVPPYEVWVDPTDEKQWRDPPGTPKWQGALIGR